MTDPWKKFLQEELNNEANQIEKEVNSDASVDDIKATPKMYEELMAKIQEAEAGKEGEKYKGLTEEELEYLRIGRELKENGGKIVYMRRKMPKRKALVLAAVMVVLVMGAGVTSVGGPQHLLEMFTEMRGNKEQVHLDSSEGKIKRGGSEEENAYSEIKEELGVEPVRMYYLPEGTAFKSINKNELANMISIEYSYHDRNLIYQIVPSSRARTSSIDIADELIGSYQIDNNNTVVSIKQYKISNSNDLQYFAYFENQNQYYVISAIMDQKEFDKIIENLKLF